MGETVTAEGIETLRRIYVGCKCESSRMLLLVDPKTEWILVNCPCRQDLVWKSRYLARSRSRRSPIRYRLSAFLAPLRKRSPRSPREPETNMP